MIWEQYSVTPIPFPLGNTKALLHLLFHESAAGVQVSGDSGAGKSVAMEGIARALARHVPFMLIDPHGTTAEAVYHHCLDLGPSVARRTLYIKPADTQTVVSINPLAMPEDDSDRLAWGARRSAKVEHVSKILLSAWGEDDFNSKPVLFKWVTRILDTLSFVGLSIADARLFLDTASPVYRSLLKAVPDLLAQHEMQELPGMRPADREGQIASTKNRFLGFLANPVIEAILGKARGGLDIEQLYRDGMIVIVNLQRGGDQGPVLREQDQEILANLWLNEIIHCVMSQPMQLLRPYFVMIDELPVFESSSSLLIAALAQIRKFKLRIIAAHQGCNMFPDRTEDRLLHAFVSQCRTHFYFRHGNFADAEYFGKTIELPSIDPLKVKHEHWDKEQYQAGREIVSLTDRSESSTTTDQHGGSEATGVTSTDTSTNTTSSTETRSDSLSHDAQALRDAVSGAHAVASGSSTAHGHSNATSNTHTDTWSSSTAHGTTTTFKQTIVPKMAWRDVLRSIQFFSTDEQFIMAASKLASLETGRAIMYVSGRGATHVVFPHVRDPYERLPKFGRKRAEQHRSTLTARPEHDTLEAIEQQRSEIVQTLVDHLNALGSGELPSPFLVASRRALPEPRHGDNGPTAIRPGTREERNDSFSELENEGDTPWQI